MKKTIMFLVFVLGIFSLMPLYAGINDDLSNFFDSLGYGSNVTSGHAYQGQAAGYYSAGSVFLRNQVRNIQIMHVDVPGFRAGCGGIDLFSGGFSFINSQALTEFFKKVLTNASGYTMQLALETTVPEIAHTLQFIQQEAAKINNANMSSCELGEDLVGGMWPKTRASQQHVCEDIGSQDNAFSDWAAARQGCGAGTQFDDEMNKASTDPNYKDRVLINKNIVWDALRKNSFLSSDAELSELFMSLSGTIVYDDKGKSTPYPSLADNRGLIKALLIGGKATIYQCKDTGSTSHCVDINPTGTVNISADNALVARVNKLILEMADQVRNDAGITDEEKGFLDQTNVPILKFITVLSELKIDSSAMDITQYTDVIAEDILVQYMQEALKIIKQSMATSDYTPDVQKNIEDKINNAQAVIAKMQADSYRKIQDTFALIQNMQFLEQQVSANLSSSLQGNINFGVE